MNQSTSDQLLEPLNAASADPGPGQNTSRERPVLHFPAWRTKAILIESIIIIFGFASVVVYNWLFSASISPVFGLILGVVNGSLVAWCITHADQFTNRKSETRN